MIIASQTANQANDGDVRPKDVVISLYAMGNPNGKGILVKFRMSDCSYELVSIPAPLVNYLIPNLAESKANIKRLSEKARRRGRDEFVANQPGFRNGDWDAAGRVVYKIERCNFFSGVAFRMHRLRNEPVTVAMGPLVATEFLAYLESYRPGLRGS